MPSQGHYFLPPTAAPAMPSQEDELRAQVTEAMHAVLDDDWSDVAMSYLEQCVDPESLEVWGRPDTSDNVFADMSTTLSEPGHYGRAWNASHPNRSANKLVAPGGMLDRGRYRSRAKYTERMAWGLGDYLLHIQAPAPDRLTFTPVRPDRIYAESAMDDPSRFVVLWHARLRYIKAIDRRVWCWDQYDILDPKDPKFQVVTAEMVTPEGVEPIAAGTDITAMLFGDYLQRIGADGLSGSNYKWRTKSGEPWIPYPVLRTRDSGRQWNYTARYGSFLATLVISLLSTYTMHAARDASGSFVVFTGIQRPGTDTRNNHSDRSAPMLRITAGSALFAAEDPESKNGPKSFNIAPGTNLQALSMYLHQMRAQAAARFGVGGGEAVRNDANPTSASALLITEAKKMQAVRSADELFRAFDRDVLKTCSVCLRAWGVEVPEDGYSITYYHPPATPAEMREQREQENHDVDKGYRSQVQVYMERNPGTDRAAAIRALAEIQADRVAVERAVAALESGEEMEDNIIILDVDEYEDTVDELDAAAEVLANAARDGREPDAEEMASVSAAIVEALSLLGGAVDVEDDAPLSPMLAGEE